ncbi:MAG TPA: hypothetical protein VJ720_10065, partial [Chitinophaga sp.]|nr:hypothetical protein [Chitinophaga sp.]
IFADRHLYFALLLALVIILPNLIWQISHHFPVFKHMKELQETQLVHVNRLDFFIEQLLFFICGIFVLLAGIIGLIINKQFRQHQWVLFTYIITLLIFSYFRAKGYYALGLYTVLLAFGSVYLAQVVKRPVFRTLLLAFITGSFTYLLPLIMPLYSPVQIIAHHNKFQKAGLLKWNNGKEHELPQDYADMLGWKELATIVDSAYRMVPDKEHLLVLCDNYGQAGAINYYSVFGNIHAASFDADYIHWMDLEKPIRTKIRIREYDSRAAAAEDSLNYGSMQKIGMIKNRYSLEYGTAVYLLKDPKIDVNADLKSYIKEE